MARRIQTMMENREKLIAAARQAFTDRGYAEASMDELTASVGLTRGALYHNFGSKEGLLAAVVAQIDGEMAKVAQQAGAQYQPDQWQALLAEGKAYIQLALDRQVQRIVLRDGPAVLGDPSLWPSQNSCLEATKKVVASLIAQGIIRPLDVEAVSRLLSGAAMNAALWVAASDQPDEVLPKALEAFEIFCSGLRAPNCADQ